MSIRRRSLNGDGWKAIRLKSKKADRPRGRVRYLNDKERERLLKACQESEPDPLYVVVLAISTGMRHGEI